MIIVHTKDITLVCPKTEAQRVKELVGEGEGEVWGEVSVAGKPERGRVEIRHAVSRCAGDKRKRPVRKAAKLASENDGDDDDGGRPPDNKRIKPMREPADFGGFLRC